MSQTHRSLKNFLADPLRIFTIEIAIAEFLMRNISKRRQKKQPFNFEYENFELEMTLIFHNTGEFISFCTEHYVERHGIGNRYF